MEAVLISPLAGLSGPNTANQVFLHRSHLRRDHATYPMAVRHVHGRTLSVRLSGLYKMDLTESFSIKLPGSHLTVWPFPDKICSCLHGPYHHTGEITIGDSHEYGLVHDPFDKDFINHLIWQYLKTFCTFKQTKVVQTWHGIYPKMTNGETELILTAEDGVTIINGLGGNGMTLSFGLCEQIIGAMFD
ncbi:FAD-dependent oxidoreductase [Pedobacter sp. KLB.chiD]|uniref:FAD-dependent oxidoreductase n=1 Tax=Pedobacter sp. KLB.chiD TaxID=3387402 RepID=UPI00399AA3C8